MGAGRPYGRSMRRILVSTVLLAVAVSLAGCSAPGSSSDEAVPAGRGSEPSIVENGAAADSSVAGLVEQDRSVVTTGTMTITADKPLDAAREAVRIVEGAGGRVDARTEKAPTKDNQGSASLSLRIPSSALTSTLDELRGLGDKPDVALSSVDVTTEAHDLDARISALRASVERLTALLASATDTKVLIELESAISERQGNLESMEAQQRTLADQVSLSTLDLSLISVTDAPVEQPDTFWSGLAAGWGAFTGFVGFLLVAAGVLLPWTLAAAAIAAVVVVVVRVRRRRVAAQPAA
jgi:uncharacterized small protein (DUF1192 family)